MPATRLFRAALPRGCRQRHVSTDVWGMAAAFSQHGLYRRGFGGATSTRKWCHDIRPVRAACVGAALAGRKHLESEEAAVTAVVARLIFETRSPRPCGAKRRSRAHPFSNRGSLIVRHAMSENRPGQDQGL